MRSRYTYLVRASPTSPYTVAQALVSEANRADLSSASSIHQALFPRQIHEFYNGVWRAASRRRARVISALQERLLEYCSAICEETHRLWIVHAGAQRGTVEPVKRCEPPSCTSEYT